MPKTKTKINYYTNIEEPSLNMSADILQYIADTLHVSPKGVQVVSAKVADSYPSEGDVFYDVTIAGSDNVIKRIAAAEKLRIKSEEE